MQLRAASSTIAIRTRRELSYGPLEHPNAKRKKRHAAGVKAFVPDEVGEPALTEPHPA